MEKKDYSKLFSDARKRDSYWIADATYSFVEDLHMATVEQKITYAQLAAKIGKSPAYITRVMRGDYNLTIATMVKLARAMDCQLDIHVRKQAEKRGLLFSLVRSGQEPIRPKMEFKEDDHAGSPGAAA